jgi:glutamate 5-kinase
VDVVAGAALVVVQIQRRFMPMPTPAKRKRIVLKFGSGILTRAGGIDLEPKQIAKLTAEIAMLVEAGHQCIAVTSAAVAAGISALRLSERPKDLATAQASAAVGQSKLMRAYETAFARYKLNVAQLLLTHSDLDSRTRRMNAKNTLERLLAAGNIVPIINENDSVAVEELRFGDNDRLSAEVAMLAGATLLLILTQVDGLMDSSGRVIARVRDVGRVRNLATETKGKFSQGGMISKLQAVEMAVEAGITTIILNGRRPHLISEVVAGKQAGTHFVARCGNGAASLTERRS